MIAGFAPNQDEGIEAAALEAADYCAMEKEELYVYIQEKRSELKEVTYSYEAQKERRAQLNKVFESYSKCD
jgi:phosphoribulokinase